MPDGERLNGQVSEEVSTRGMISRLQDFPSIGLTTSRQPDSPTEVVFTGEKVEYAVCFVDMIDSTYRTAAQAAKGPVGQYYGAFLNSIAEIVNKFHGVRLKNVGDALIFCFRSKPSEEENKVLLRSVLDCCLTIISPWTHNHINAQVSEGGMAPLDYRVSADYGLVEVARSIEYGGMDLFGSPMNLCAKINSFAPRNRLVIGSSLYEKVRLFSEYSFEIVGTYKSKSANVGTSGSDGGYPVYLTKSS